MMYSLQLDTSLSALGNLLEVRSRAAGQRRLAVQLSLSQPADLIDFARCMSCSDLPIQMSAGRLSSTVARLDLGPIAVAYAVGNRDLIIEDSAVEKTISLHADRGVNELEFFTEPRLVLRPADRPCICVTPLQRDQAFDEALINELVDYRATQASPEEGAVWNAVQALLEAAAQQADPRSSDATAVTLPSDLILTIVDTFIHKLCDYHQAQDSRTATALPKLLNLARDRGTLRLDDLLEDLRMTRRNLHYCATRNVGVAPKRLVKSMALRNVMLAIPDSTRTGKSIGDIAFENGFQDFSRFCQDYRTLFGERAGDTLRRHASR